MTNKNIIFLDIDGVLNSVAHGIAFSGTHTAYRACTIDEVAIGLLKWTVKMTGAEVVISSTWRSEGIDWIKGVFETKGWGLPPIVGKTPGSGGHRGSQIDEYLRSKYATPDKYVCIDDSSDFYDYQNLIQTDPNLGYTMYDAIKVIDVLGCLEEHLKKVESIRGHVDFQLNKKGNESAKLKIDSNYK